MELQRAVSLYKSGEGKKKKRKVVIHVRCVYVCTGARSVGELFWYTLGRELDHCFQNYPPPYLSPTSPFHLNSLFIGSNTTLLSQNKTNPKSHLSKFIFPLPLGNLLCLTLRSILLLRGLPGSEVVAREKGDKANRELHSWQVTQTVLPMTFPHTDNGKTFLVRVASVIYCCVTLGSDFTHGFNLCQ